MTGILPKASLTAGRAIQYPFAIPKRLDQSAVAVGAAVHNSVGKINAALAESMAMLQPRIGAELLGKTFQRIDTAVQKSAKIADRNHQVFWGPVGEGFDKVGTALGSPFAYYYAKSAGFPEPGNSELLSALLHSPFTTFPAPAPAQG